MKTFWASVTILVAAFLPGLLAYGPRGASERTLYWLAYLAEEQSLALDSTYAYTIAPGCVGSRAGGRCNLDELLQYIWAPNAATKDTKAPTSVVPSTGITDAVSTNFKTIFYKIKGAKFNTGAVVSGNIDIKKLMPSASGYTKALANMGTPIDQLVQRINKQGSKYKISTAQKNIVSWGRDSAYLTTALRRTDMDVYRIPFLKSYFGTNKPPGLSGTFNPVTKSIATPLGTPVTVLDVDGTINQYKSSVPDIQTRLQAANTSFMNQQKNGKYTNTAHQSMLSASHQALTTSRCQVSFPRDLKKKRSVEITPGEKFPLAMRSMKAKAQKLAFSAATAA